MGEGNYDLRALGVELRRARNALRWTRSELARESSLALSTVQRMENGWRSPTLEQVIVACRALEADPVVVVDAGFSGCSAGR